MKLCILFVPKVFKKLHTFYPDVLYQVFPPSFVSQFVFLQKKFLVINLNSAVKQASLPVHVEHLKNKLHQQRQLSWQPC